MLLKFSLILFLFFSFSSCQIIKELKEEEVKKKRDLEYKELNNFSQSLRKKAKKIKDYIKSQEAKGKEVIRVRPGLFIVTKKVNKCLSRIYYRQRTQFRVTENSKFHYIRNCLRYYETNLNKLEEYYYHGQLVSGKKKMPSREEKERAIKEQEARRADENRKREAENLYTIISTTNGKSGRELYYRKRAYDICTFRLMGQGKFVRDSCIDIEVIKLKNLWEKQIKKFIKTLDRKSLNTCLSRKRKMKSDYKLCLKKNLEENNKYSNSGCKAPEFELCIKRFTLKAIMKLYNISSIHVDQLDHWGLDLDFWDPE